MWASWANNVNLLRKSAVVTGVDVVSRFGAWNQPQSAIIISKTSWWWYVKTCHSWNKAVYEMSFLKTSSRFIFVLFWGHESETSKSVYMSPSVLWRGHPGVSIHATLLGVWLTERTDFLAFTFYGHNRGEVIQYRDPVAINLIVSSMWES